MNTCSVIIVVSNIANSAAWLRCLESLTASLKKEELAEVILAAPSYLKADLSKPLSKMEKSTFVPIESHKKEILRTTIANLCNGTFLLFIEEPILFSSSLITEMISRFTHESIAAVLPKMSSGSEDGVFTFPRSYGFKRHFRVPHITESVVMIRQSAMLAVKGFSNIEFSAQWLDLSWRFQFAHFILYYSASLTVVSLVREQLTYRYSLISSWQKGKVLANFVVEWRHTLYGRSVRFFFRMKHLVSIRTNLLLDIIRKDGTSYLIKNLSLEAFSALSFAIHLLPAVLHLSHQKVTMKGLPSVPFKLDESSNNFYTLYPWTFYYQDDFGFYSSRILLADSLFHSSDDRDVILNLLKLERQLHNGSSFNPKCINLSSEVISRLITQTILVKSQGQCDV